MGGFGDAWEKMITSNRFNITRYATSELFVGLCSQDPVDDGSGVSEPGPDAAGRGVLGDKGYARVKTTNASATSWQVADATGTTIDNSAIITFAAASDDWGTMTHFALFSGGTAGASVLAHGALSTSKTIENGDTARFAIGALDICLK